MEVVVPPVPKTPTKPQPSPTKSRKDKTPLEDILYVDEPSFLLCAHCPIVKAGKIRLNLRKLLVACSLFICTEYHAVGM